jgi:hypothetical protein
LRGRGRMTKAERAAHGETLTTEKQAKEIRQASLEELARAQRRIAALERKIGQQQVELDFFQQALQVRNNAYGAACLAGQRLRSHPSDDGVTVARRARNRTHVPARRHRPVRLIDIGSARASPLRLPTDRRSPAARWLASQSQAGAALDARGNPLCLRQTPFVPMATNSRHTCVCRSQSHSRYRAHRPRSARGWLISRACIWRRSSAIPLSSWTHSAARLGAGSASAAELATAK